MIEINGMQFEKAPGAKYLHDYEKIAQDIKGGVLDPINTYRTLVQTDLFFIVYFVLRIPIANHAFVVAACNMVQTGPRTDTNDVWAREHFKSTIITFAESLQDLSNNSEERIGLFSYVKPLAMSFLRQIKYELETNQFLKDLFPDIFYQDPKKDAFKWSEEAGLYVKRSGSYKEPSVSAWGLTEGMPTGYHFTKRVYDDVTTQDLADSPDMNDKVKERFDMSENCGTDGGRQRVTGTYYRHDDCLTHVTNLQDELTKTPIFQTRVLKATKDGTITGPSVFMSEERLAKLRGNLKNFKTQQLCDPTPYESIKFDKNHIQILHPGLMPDRLWKFIVVDPAGDTPGDDSWAIACVGIEPIRDEVGLSNLYILDLIISPFELVDAQEAIVEMYKRNGKIAKVGVEKVGISTMEIHIAAALRASGKNLTIESKSLVILQPGGRSKQFRIESALAWPTRNGKVHMSTAVLPAHRERLFLEMDRFPAWHEDGLDTLSYVYDMIKEYNFPTRDASVKKEEDVWDRAFKYVPEDDNARGWLSV